MKNTTKKLAVLAVLAIVTVSIAKMSHTAPSAQAHGTSPVAGNQLQLIDIMPRDAYLTFRWPISMKIIRPKVLAAQSHTFYLADGTYCLVD